MARWTNVLASDPIIWFVMMLMPVGPPAMRLVALADVAHLPEEARMATAKLLTVGVFFSTKIFISQDFPFFRPPGPSPEIVTAHEIFVTVTPLTPFSLALSAAAPLRRAR